MLNLKTIAQQKEELIAFISNFDHVEYGVCVPTFTIGCPNPVVADTLAKAISAMGYPIREHAQPSMFMVTLVEPTITLDQLAKLMAEFTLTQSDDDEDIKNGPTSRSTVDDVFGKFCKYIGILAP